MFFRVALCIQGVRGEQLCALASLSEGWPAVSQHNVHIEAAGQSISETYGNNICVVTGHLVTHAVERLLIPARGLVPWRRVCDGFPPGKSTDRQGFSYALIQYLAIC